MMRWLLVMPIILIGACVDTEHTWQAITVAQQAQQKSMRQYPRRQWSAPQPTIIDESSFYVPPLQASTETMPAWYGATITVDFRGLPLTRALAEILHGLAVEWRIEDDIDGQQPISLRQAASVGEVLKTLAQLTGLFFDIRAHQLIVGRLQVEEFDVAYLIGDHGFQMGEKQSALSALGGQNTSSQYSTLSAERSSLWQELAHSIELLLSDKGEVVVNESATSVVVKDRPLNVERVRRYLAEQNQRLTKQVAIDVQVIDITFNDDAQQSVDWQLVAGFDGMRQRLQIGQLQTGQDFSGVMTQALWQRQGGRFDGSQLLVKALRQQGVVKVTHHPQLLSLSNQVAHLSIENETSYLASSGVRRTPDAGSDVLLEPGVVVTGFELYVLPKVYQHHVVLQLSTQLSDLLGLEQVQSGDNTIQTPRTSRKSFFLRAAVKQGETLLLSGFHNSREQDTASKGLLSWMFGGNRRHQTAQSETLLLLTPHASKGVGAQQWL
ncbi:hypothetical protein CWI84_04785 [Idiomarina tyrosinivorans]|uniref:Type II/III secretion system secretin-like domain-containing protein n=1 Tax=Idiomarina tyrosinivorans TaxID=1445662 RepID=A0A432ZR59_9GAMM|nr:hypothetical protein [Idiomarina tyrosinivorans]RUO80387.1 hypothetical protein CWI84_04785 [Idiomarina tyrosinivorans]